jgi:hypothetical protein
MLQADAFLLQPWSYRALFNKADLVVIAKPISTRETKERSVLSGIRMNVVGMETELETRLVLKGDKSVKKLTLHYYKAAGPPVVGEPPLITFDLTEPWAYLLFLVRRPDGTYDPVTDQAEAADFAVIKLTSPAALGDGSSG